MRLISEGAIQKFRPPYTNTTFDPCSLLCLHSFYSLHSKHFWQSVAFINKTGFKCFFLKLLKSQSRVYARTFHLYNQRYYRYWYKLKIKSFCVLKIVVMSRASQRFHLWKANLYPWMYLSRCEFFHVVPSHLPRCQTLFISVNLLSLSTFQTKKSSYQRTY